MHKRQRLRGEALAVLPLGLAFVVVAAMSGCSALPVGYPDASTRFDAALADSGGLRDGGPGLDSGMPDLPDAGVCWLGECDPRGGAGCDGGVCVLNSEVGMCSAAGMLGAGDTCYGVDECAPGLACFRVGGRGECHHVCCPGDGRGCAAAEQTCRGSGVLVDGTATSWGRCTDIRRCDVLEPGASCEEREGCFIVDADGNTECRVAGTQSVGESCLEQEDCEGGLFCGGIGNAKRCVRICSVVHDDCPSDEGRCVAQAHSPEGSGLCTLGTTARRGF